MREHWCSMKQRVVVLLGPRLQIKSKRQSSKGHFFIMVIYNYLIIEA